MSVPLDRLYHYIKSIAEEVREDNVIIYHFWPHGSKNVENIVELQNKLSLYQLKTSPRIICHDQEPLDFDYYAQFPCNLLPPSLSNLSVPKQNNYDQSILIHSELQSMELVKYREAGYIPVFYWSHALIARDWFRYAEHVEQEKNVEQTFLVYNRAWSGTREYRLGFADRIICDNLVDDCRMRINPIDSTLDKHYDLHHFTYPEWRPQNVIEKYFPLCQAESHYSADFDLEDYESTNIEIVLETLFDGQRLHLTEKILRPIAMGQPFILAGARGCLTYLKHYGFKTFSDCWDESYDMMSDSLERMNKIVEVMKQITRMPPLEQEEILAKAREIAVYNRQHFFSNTFSDQVLNELKNNLKTAYTQLTPKS